MGLHCVVIIGSYCVVIIGSYCVVIIGYQIHVPSRVVVSNTCTGYSPMPHVLITYSSVVSDTHVTRTEGT